MNKRTIAKGFIIVSVIFIITLCAIYGYRLVHFYKLEHPKVQKEAERLLNSTLTEQNHIVTSGDGLYQDHQSYYYKGNVQDNYVRYSSILWRVVRVNEDGSVTLISDTPLTSMVFGYEVDDFKSSYVYKWLNETFYSQLKNSEQYLLDTNYCADAITDSNDVSCDKIETSKVAMISVYEYLKATGSKSYLNDSKSFWSLSPNTEHKIWFMNQNGLVNNESFSGESYHSYGVRPMITVKGDLKILSGVGTSDDPYQFENNTSTVLKEQTVGSYVTYSDQVWRMIEVNDLGVKVALNGYIKLQDTEVKNQFAEDSNIFSIQSTENIGYYLNSTYYDSLKNKEYLVDYPWKVSYYNSSQKYQYPLEAVETVRATVGLLQISDLFLNDFSDYALINPASGGDGTIFTVLEDGRLYAGMITEPLKIRPAIVLKDNLNITGGSGTEKDPFVLGV